jgi:pyruvate formate-lyase activating enzyme-like uncharacterized protein
MKKLKLLLPLILVGCSSSVKDSGSIKERPSRIEMLNGMARLSFLLNEKNTINDFKVMFKDDFDKKSKKFNPETNCTEYKIHIYPSLKRQTVVGFDKNGNYIYFIEVDHPKIEKRNTINWAKDFEKKYK